MLDYRRNFYFQSLKIIQFCSFSTAFFLSLCAIAPVSMANVRRIAIYGDSVGFVLINLGFIFLVSSNLYSNNESFLRPTLRENTAYTVVASLLIAMMMFIFEIIYRSNYNQLGVLVFLILSPLIFILYQSILDRFLRYYNNRPANIRHVLIVGSNERAKAFASYLEKQDIFGCKILGYIDESFTDSQDINVIGGFDQFKSVIREHIVDFVVVHLPVRSFYDKIAELITISEEQGISTYYLNNVFEPRGSHVKAETMGSMSTIVFYSSPLVDWKMLIKRIFDIVVALAVIIITLPLCILAAIAILVSDFGPIFYLQRRVGYRKRIFTIIKFRTMYQNAHEMQAQLEQLNEMDGPVFKIRNDPRIIPIGRFLRKFSIDELPQIINVLKGDMSIVGPRPLPLRDYDGFSEDWLRRRFSVRPGLTCYWQSSPNRNKISFETWMRMDMEYIDKWSLWGDIKICFMTVAVVLSGQGS